MRRITKISAVTVSLMLAGAGTAFADTTDPLTVEVVGGGLSVEMVTAPTFSLELPLSANMEHNAPMDIKVIDHRGTGEGWSVTQVLDELTYDGAGVAAKTLSNSDIHVSSLENVFATGLGDTPAVAGNNPIFGSRNFGDMAVGQTILEAAPGTGLGAFSASFLLDINAPATVLAGSYSALLTTSIVSGEL